jgi:hypothetical protein
MGALAAVVLPLLLGLGLGSVLLALVLLGVEVASAQGAAAPPTR